jgi:hypothetical protein
MAGEVTGGGGPPVVHPVGWRNGVLQQTHTADDNAGSAIYGDSLVQTDPGVWGQNEANGPGVIGQSGSGIGVEGIVDSGIGVSGEAYTGGIGVAGSGRIGVQGVAGVEIATPPTLTGVFGEGKKNGVHGRSASATDSGVWGENTGGGYGVSGSTTSPDTAGVWGDNFSGPGVKGTSAMGYGVWAQSQNAAAGHFEGHVEVTGDVFLLNELGADCAEDFDVDESTDPPTPGAVLVIGHDGKLSPCCLEYDSRVAGVVSGAGSLHPAIVLRRTKPAQNRAPIALIGKVFCKVDATLAPIKAGDLLTTASTPGHAMKVMDRAKAVGAILGKALDSMESGCGLIPILVSAR